MFKTGIVVGPPKSALVAMALAFVAGPIALAEQAKEVTVSAPEVTRERVGRAGATRAPIDLITVTHRVSYADLDLTKAADDATLRSRIEEAARSACSQMRQLVRNERADPRCVQNAIDRGMEQVRAAIAASK
jgi:UrcA family protein